MKLIFYLNLRERLLSFYHISRYLLNLNFLLLTVCIRASGTSGGGGGGKAWVKKMSVTQGMLLFCHVRRKKRGDY